MFSTETFLIGDELLELLLQTLPFTLGELKTSPCFMDVGRSLLPLPPVALHLTIFLERLFQSCLSKGRMPSRAGCRDRCSRQHLTATAVEYSLRRISDLLFQCFQVDGSGAACEPFLPLQDGHSPGNGHASFCLPFLPILFEPDLQDPPWGTGSKSGSMTQPVLGWLGTIWCHLHWQSKCTGSCAQDLGSNLWDTKQTAGASDFWSLQPCTD